MVTQVSFGSFSTVNGKNVLTGIGGSGLNTTDLIASLSQAKGTQATQDQTQITANNTQMTALNQFQQLLSNFQSAADALRNPPGVNNAANNVFQFTSGSVSANGSSALTVSTQPGATLQSYTINDITQLATTSKQSSGVFTLASANASAVSASPIVGSNYQFGVGTFTLNGQSITLNEGDSLNTVAAKFNAVSNSTNVSATVIQISSNQFELQFNATNTGAADSFDLSNSSYVTDASNVLNNIGLTEQQSTGTFTIADPSQTIVSSSPIGGTANQFAPGTITFAGGATVTLNEGDSLQTVANAFNAVTAQTGIRANIIEPSTGNFKLVFTGVQGSTSFDMTNVGTVSSDPSGALTPANIGATSAGNAATAGLDAQFRVNGISIDRSSNNVDDVINGVTFNLLDTTAANADITVTVNPDTTTVQNAIVNFVNTYNAIRTFAAQQTQLNADGTYATTAVLAGNASFRNIMANLTQEVTSEVSGLSGSLTSLADVGITLTTQPATTGTNATPQVDNILTVNDGQLSSALATNFQGVSSLFGFSLTSNNANLAVYSATKALSANSFTLNIDPGTSTFTADLGGGNIIDLTPTALPGSLGYLLTGPAGSALDGLNLIYAGTATATINVTATQGIADQMYDTANAATTANTGTLAQTLSTLQASNTSLNDDITRVNQMVTQYKNTLLQQFSALEQVVSSVNSILNALAANDQAHYTSSLTS